VSLDADATVTATFAPCHPPPSIRCVVPKVVGRIKHARSRKVKKGHVIS
jgi:hypothetical protein